MSGHAGIYYFDQRPIDRGLATRLGEGLASQGPDGGSEQFGPGFLMVYRAFNFDPLSRSERQPYRSAKGNWITFDGRLDNRDDLELLVADHLREDQTDVALALAAYEKWGDMGLNRLIGDWSVAIWDDQRRAIVLASDYMGVRPLFYCQREGFIAWSSSLSLMVDWMDVFDDLDNAYIAGYLGRMPTYNRTIYQGVSYVACGQTVSTNGDGNLEQSAFWRPPVGNRIRYRTDADYEEHLLHLFREAVLARLRTDQVVCCDLSGGLDSSSVTCMANHLIRSGTAAPAKLITLSLSPPDMDDDHFVAVVERHCSIAGIHLRYRNQRCLELPAGPMPILGLPVVLEIINARRKHSVRVSLTGQGGDQVMGNRSNETGQLADSLQNWQIFEWVRKAYEWARAQRVPIWLVLWDSISPLLSSSTQQRWWSTGDVARSDAYSSLARHSLVKPSFLKSYLDNSQRNWIDEYREAVPSQRYFLYDLETLRARHAMATSYSDAVKPSHAFYHRPLLEFTASIPREQLYSAGRPRSLMRRAFRGLLPEAVVERRTKATFRTAMDLDLQELVPALLASPSGLATVTRGYAHPARLKEALRHPQATDFRRADLLPLLNLEIWFQTRHGPNAKDARSHWRKTDMVRQVSA